MALVSLADYFGVLSETPIASISSLRLPALASADATSDADIFTVTVCLSLPKWITVDSPMTRICVT